MKNCILGTLLTSQLQFSAIKKVAKIKSLMVRVVAFDWFVEFIYASDSGAELM